MQRSKDVFMRSKLSLAVLLAMVFGAMPLLSACHTTAGAGQDLSAAGHSLSQSAEQHTHY
jgi:predicted small secreted protein